MPGRLLKIEDFDRVLVVEGYSDLLFFAELLEEIGKPGQVFIQQIEGTAGLEEKLETFITPALLAAKTKIGFIFDADADAQRTGDRLQRLLSRLTGQTVTDGTWTTGKPQIGLFIVPGSGVNGEIETLVWRAWINDPANAGQRQCIEQFIACMQGQHVQAHSPDKAPVGALLAIRHDDDPRLGPAARDNVLDLNRPEYEPLKAFLAAF